MQSRMIDLIERIDAAGQRRAAAAGDRHPDAARVRAAVSALRAGTPKRSAQKAARDDDRVAGLADVFALDEVDALLLWAAAAAELDLNVAEAYAALRGSASPGRATVQLLLELAGVRSDSPQALARLGQDAPLRRHRLVHVDGTDAWVSRHVVVDEPVLAAVVGADPCDPDVLPLRTPLVPTQLPGAVELGKALVGGAPLAWVRAHGTAAGAALAAAAVEQVGLRAMGVDMRRAGAGHDLRDLVARVVREAALRARVLVVLGGDVLGAAAEHGVFRPFADSAVPVVIVASGAWHGDWLPRMPYVMVAEPLTVAQRASVWQEQLRAAGRTEPLQDETLLGLRLAPEEVAETVGYAQTLASVRDRPLGPELVREAARLVGSSRGSGAGRIDASDPARRLTFDDLVLPDNVTDTLHRLVSWGRHRQDLAAHAPLRRHSRGIAALFAGNPGTGKTLAARVVAEELSLDLLQVELSSVVDKYIGETEKNLERVFQAAEALDVVLFFDEADALFGSRSEVHDARDRYANQEIAYLLQRMEQFEGITILATNLRGNLDRAFSRRMSFIVHFPDPEADIRRQLWDYHLAQLPALDAGDPIAVDFLAAEAELTGGDIRNIVVAAAYDAIGAGEPVGMRHVIAASIREYHKLGRVLPAHGFAAPRSRSAS